MYTGSCILRNFAIFKYRIRFIYLYWLVDYLFVSIITDIWSFDTEIIKESPGQSG